MPSRRRFLTCTGVSVLLHLLVLWLAYRFPHTVRRPEEVMEIDLSDLPRSTDFLPPEPGILEGRPPPPVRQAPAPSREAPKEVPAPRVLEGRVPDLPVRPDLPPEKSFPPMDAKPEPASPPAPGASAPGNAPGKSGTPTPGPSKTLRDLTPSLGKMVMALEEPSGGRGQGAAVSAAPAPSGVPARGAVIARSPSR